MSRRATAAQKRHWDAVAAMGCIITGGPATIHHCHGGSMKDRGVHRGAGMKTSNWLVIPLAERLHTGPGGIDGFPRPSVEEWEAKHGRQADLLDEVARRLGVDVWAFAASEEKPTPRAAITLADQLMGVRPPLKKRKGKVVVLNGLQVSSEKLRKQKLREKNKRAAENRKKDPERQAAREKYLRDWAQTNNELRKEYRRRWKKDNAEWVKAYQKNWRRGRTAQRTNEGAQP